jgi:hypothetical protein
MDDPNRERQQHGAQHRPPQGQPRHEPSGMKQSVFASDEICER